MPLHHREAIRERLEDCIFAGHNLSVPVPKYRFPDDRLTDDERAPVPSAGIKTYWQMNPVLAPGIRP